jgi:Domain of unknown function (DUF1802)
MAISYSIANALDLPAVNFDLLCQGKSMVIFPWVFLSPGQTFALTKTTEPLATGQSSYWARCESCKTIDSPTTLESLKHLFPWSWGILDHHFDNKNFVFVAAIRVYHLVSKIEILQNHSGDFFSLKEPMIVDTSHPVLLDRVFEKRRRQLENLAPSEYPNLEIFQQQIEQSSSLLNQDLKVFLEWEQLLQNNECIVGNEWIREINEIGNSSDGNEFEKLVRRSFLFLGFTNSLNNIRASLDPNATGGAGGIDIYCDSPFSLVGECKASKHESVPNSVSAQLIHLGTTHLGRKTFDRSVKIIFAAGLLTSAAQQAAVQNQMNVMTPHTLQRLIMTKARYPGSIDLRELEQCLKQEPFGQDADSKVNMYIDVIEQRIASLSHVISALKDYLESQTCKELGIDKFHVVFELSHPPQKYSEMELYQMMIELSSPLSGYLGRIKGENWRSDRFYFLRDLIT